MHKTFKQVQLIKTSKYILLLLCSLAARPAAAQPHNIKSTVLNENGRPVKINVIYKNRQGIIAAGTAAGLYLFDGTPEFKKIPFADSSINAPVTAIFEDADATLWAGYQDGRIARRMQYKLTVFAPEEGTPAAAVTCFAQDRQGNIWFGTAGEGIYYLQGRHLYNIDETDGLSDLNIHALQAAADGSILAATDQGINICRAAGAQKKITVLTTLNGLPDNLVTCFAPAGEDRYWIGLQDRGCCLYNHRTQSFSTFSSNWPHGQVNSMHATAAALWVATAASGVFRLPLSNPSLVPASATYSFAAPLTGFLQDGEGNFWISAGNSMLRTSGERLQLHPLFEPDQFTAAHAILAAADGSIWVGGNKAVYRYGSGDTKQRLKVPIAGLGSSNAITALYQDVSGTIWAGTMGRGIFLINPVTGACRALEGLPGPPNRSILSISGRGSDVYICSLEGPLHAVVPQQGGRYSFSSFEGISSAGSSYVYSIFPDSRNRLWFASFGRGLTLLENGVYRNFGKSSGAGSDIVYSVTEDRKGNIWYSTGDAGLGRFNGSSFALYGIAQGLSSVDISAIKTDTAGNIVVVHKKGLDIINPATGAVSNIGSSMGIETINTDDLGCVARSSSGAIFFSTSAGIGVYNAISGTSQQPVTLIRNVRLFLDDMGPQPRSIFRHDEDNITFEFTGLYYTDPEQVQYQYRLEGYDTSWISTKNDNAPFARLSPGHYTFRVRSSLSSDFSRSAEAVFAFTIEKPWWTTWWFILLSIAAAAALLYWYIRAREKNLKHVERLRQEKYQFQFEVLRNQVNPHFLFNSFNTLISTIEENPKAAVSYVEQLSDFFRNIVNYRDRDVIPLKEETGLLRTYFYLQQQRYGSNLQLHIRCSEKDSEAILIPPLTLQLLMENAIKHNAVSRETVLAVELYVSDDGYLVVRNNINPRKNREAGAGMGLQNIVNRYGLLGGKKVLISHTAEYFTVSLPILKK